MSAQVAGLETTVKGVAESVNHAVDAMASILAKMDEKGSATPAAVDLTVSARKERNKDD